jgi:hypothetical protein
MSITYAELHRENPRLVILPIALWRFPHYDLARARACTRSFSRSSSCVSGSVLGTEPVGLMQTKFIAMRNDER